MSGGDPHDRPSGRALASILIALLAAAAFQVFYLRLVEPPQGAYAIDSMRFLPGPAAGPARVPMSAGEQRSLPDDWLRTAPDVSEGWYVAELPDAAWQARAWGIYLPVVHMNTEIFLNDRLIARSRQFDARRDRGDPYARETNRPVYVPVPGYLDGSRVRRLRIHVESQQPGSGLLGPVYIGPDAVLSAAYGKRLAARVTTVQVVSAGMLTIAILMSVLWYLRREDSVYGWFALLVYAWALHNVFFLGLDTPLSDRFEDWVAVVALGWFVVLMAFTTHRYLGLHPVRLEHGILALAVSWSLVLAAPAWLGLSEVAAHRVWSTFALVLGGYSIARIALAYRYRQDLRNPFVLPAGLAVLLLGTHDWLLVMGLWPREDGLLMHFCAPFTLIVFASMLLERFSGVLREAESLSRELEQRVAEKHRILEDNFSKLRRMENRQILAEERERFMKEMHDGVGGHLISMLSMIRGGESDLDK
ncbi:MAG TPA: hypothetical protein ENK12_03170, partial [Gammaproteobacteria bacterium]|nr:hypothetical protein [Gammaproteobacteria bacterium]